MLYETTMTSSNNKEEEDCCSNNLEKKADLFKAIVNIKDRRYHFRTYKQCFVGRESVDTMVDSGWVDTRQEAVEIIQELERELNLFVHVCGDHTFKDDYLFYRFNSVLPGGEEGEEDNKETECTTPSSRIKKSSKKKKNKKKKKKTNKKPSKIELRRLMGEAKDLMSLDTDMSEALSRGSQLALNAQFDCTSPTSATTTTSSPSKYYGRRGDVVTATSSFDGSTILSNSEVEPIMKCFGGSYRFDEQQQQDINNEEDTSSCLHRRHNMIDTTIGFRRRKSSSTTSGCSGCDLPPMTPSRQRSSPVGGGIRRENSVNISEVIDMAIRTVDADDTTTFRRRHRQQQTTAQDEAVISPHAPPRPPLLPGGSFGSLSKSADSPPTKARRWKSPIRTRQRNGRE